VTKGLPVRTRQARDRGPGSAQRRARRAVLLAPGGGPWPPVRRVRPWFSRDKISFSGRAGQNPAQTQSVSRCRWVAVASGCHRSSSTLYRSHNRSSSPRHALHLLPPTPDPQSRQTMNGTGSGSLVTQAIGAPNTRRQTEAQGGAAGGGAADGVRSSAADAAHGQLQLLNDRVYHANGLS